MNDDDNANDATVPSTDANQSAKCNCDTDGAKRLSSYLSSLTFPYTTSKLIIDKRQQCFREKCSRPLGACLCVEG